MDDISPLSAVNKTAATTQVLFSIKNGQALYQMIFVIKSLQICLCFITSIMHYFSIKS